MSWGYRLAYSLHLTPWEAAGRGFDQFVQQQGLDAPRPDARALDIGCGTGSHALSLAARGWQVTGIDAVPRAVERARAKIAQAGADVRIVEGDVTSMSGIVGQGYDLLLDVGCFHGLGDQAREAYAREANAVAGSDATLLMLAFSAGFHGPMPRGVSGDELARTFVGWTLTRSARADTTRVPGPFKRLDPYWHWLARTG